MQKFLRKIPSSLYLLCICLVCRLANNLNKRRWFILDVSQRKHKEKAVDFIKKYHSTIFER